MTKLDKLVERMGRNPAGDWTMQDVRAVCERLGWQCLPPTGGGSHWKIAVPDSQHILTIPAKRPIKPIYIRKLIEYIKEHEHGKKG